MNNSLSVVHPELIVEWSKKNLPLTPDGITFGSNKVVWWKGSCGHEWQTSVKARSKGEKCPICSGARAVAGINDLSTLKPGLASEWSKKNEIKPTEVTIGSHKKVIWKCRLGHEWTASVKSRSINGSGCPYCSHNKVLVGFNDLATVVPKVADEWSEKNENGYEYSGKEDARSVKLQNDCHLQSERRSRKDHHFGQSRNRSCNAGKESITC